MKEQVYTTVSIFGKIKGFLWKLLLESTVLLSNNFFNTNLFLIFIKIETIIKYHFLLPGASNLAILIFLTCFSISDVLKLAAHNFINRSLQLQRAHFMSAFQNSGRDSARVLVYSWCHRQLKILR